MTQTLTTTNPSGHAVSFTLLDSSAAPVTGATPTVKLRKPGGGFVTASGTVTEVAGGLGLYEFVPTSAEADTPGPLQVRADATGARTRQFLVEVRDAVSSGEGGPSGSVDGVSRADYEQILLAEAVGKTSLTANGDGTYTQTTFKQDGTTPRKAVIFDSQGNWVSTNPNP